MPRASIIVPAYNVEKTISATLHSLVAQTFVDFEIIVVDDGGTDGTLNKVIGIKDPRIRIVRQRNRGLAGARNTGIHYARGEYIGFCDADDLWAPEKLARHVAHLDSEPEVGISFSGSRLIDDHGNAIGLIQQPKLHGILPKDVLLRNPIGNGSAAVVRRVAFDSISYRPSHETQRDWWFDENFRQSEDIEAWVRFALTTKWRIEGIPGTLTHYRINSGGLSASVEQQRDTWERMLKKAAAIDSPFVKRHGAAARAYQYRYLCRRAVVMRKGFLALYYAARSLAASIRPLCAEPIKSLASYGAAISLCLFGSSAYTLAERSILAARRRIA